MTTLLGTETGAPASLVDAPRSAPPLVSLLSSTATDEAPDGEWLSGVAYLPEGCDSPLVPFWWDCPEEGHETPGAS